MPTSIKIDFVSDVVCPWCVIGLKSLETAIARLGDDIVVDLHFQPFQLNPDMPAEGEDMLEHVARKYGSTPAQLAQRQEVMRQRGADLGFEFRMDRRNRVWNTFDAHRLLHWAELEGKQKDLKLALLSAYFTGGENPAAHDVLLRIAGEIGLDVARAAEILSSDEYAAEVNQRQAFYRGHGINGVPAIILNGHYLIEGGQPPDTFEKALRQIAAQ